jgi:ribonuclease-3
MSGIAERLREWLSRRPMPDPPPNADRPATSDEPSTGPLAGVETALGYRFRDRDLLRLALVHRSYASEADSPDSYERLEFLGDAVLQLVVTHYLYEAYPRLAEGEMAKVRAAVVDTTTLAGLAREFGLAEALLLGRGEERTGGRGKDSILADVVESLLGAVYLEAGYESVASLITRHWRDRIDRRAMAPGERDYKTRLQEKLAVEGRRPRYEIRETGPDHAKQFTAEVWADEKRIGVGTGTSKKRAEQQAAQDAATTLDATDA